MRVALYARVSTRDKQNPEVQLRELREYASKRGWEVTGEYVDRMSGTKDSRPQLDGMMKLAKARKLECCCRLEAGQVRSVATASGQHAHRTGSCRMRLCQHH